MVWSCKVVAKRLTTVLSHKNRTSISYLCHRLKWIYCLNFKMLWCNFIYYIYCIVHRICYKNITIIINGLLQNLFSG